MLCCAPNSARRSLTDHGEGPVWFADIGRLYWVDMLAGDVLSLDPAGAVTRRHVGEVAAVLRPCAAGGYVVAVERGFALVDEQGAQHSLPELWTDPAIRMNEGGCDPDGRFYAGSMDYGARPGAGALYRLDHDGSVVQVLSGVTISNGLAWSPDGSQAYYIDTPTQRVDVFDYRNGQLDNRREWIRIDPADGAPDGLTVDSEGGVWVALWGGGEVRRYDADGRLDTLVSVGASQVTACTLGGPNLDQLFITTSRLDLNGAEQSAGALFTVRVPVPGIPVRPYLARLPPNFGHTSS